MAEDTAPQGAPKAGKLGPLSSFGSGNDEHDWAHLHSVGCDPDKCEDVKAMGLKPIDLAKLFAKLLPFLLAMLNTNAVPKGGAVTRKQNAVAWEKLKMMGASPTACDDAKSAGFDPQVLWDLFMQILPIVLKYFQASPEVQGEGA